MQIIKKTVDKKAKKRKLDQKLYDRIIGSNFEDKENNINRKIEIKDILTVAPFNVQVNHLKSVLPKNSRVGTIDIFQGQEAPVTIISMTSSDAESLPRNIDFSLAEIGSMWLFQEVNVYQSL